MSDSQRKVSAEVQRLLKREVKKHMAPLKIVRMRIEEDDSGWEGGPTIRVTSEYHGKAGDVNPRKFGMLWPLLLPKLKKLGEQRWPAFAFILVGEAKNATA